MMKVCMCPATYKRLLKWARKGGLKGVLNVVRSELNEKRHKRVGPGAEIRQRTKFRKENKVQAKFIL